ncbi:hypothetical protein [Bacillus toyonensis]|uniref:hypothetical protein n=1 Tax=Bacillus toyonensis TaxID=155322 RepID=UPI000BFDA7E0|nr:hypothetical protein [Bacillus toyonensis]PHD38273.1 hypothetical protein COF48_00500 [Bacillus toyonensis]
MEVVITNINFEHVEVVHMGEKYGLIENIEFSTTFVSFDVFKKGNKLSGETKIPFEQYKKMNYEELTEHLKELLK